MKELLRKDPECDYLFWFSREGKKYSVLDCGTLMRKDAGLGADYWEKSGIFMGWEAIPVSKEGLDDDATVRADSWEELKEKLV